MADTIATATTIATTTALTEEIVTKALAAVTDYEKKATEYAAQLAELMKELCTATNFSGDAAAGYNYFYTNTVLPALNNLTDKKTGLTTGIKSILDSVRTQLLQTTDPNMGAYNKNPG